MTRFLFLQIFDLEFAHMGPSAYDLGMLTAHFLIAYFYHLALQEDSDVRRNISSAVLELCKCTGTIRLLCCLLEIHINLRFYSGREDLNSCLITPICSLISTRRRMVE